MKVGSNKPKTGFTDLGLSNDLTKILEKLKFITPTPIQKKAIPVVLQGKDVIGIAQTGTGKTLAFFLPMLQDISKNRGMGLIVVPTRELAHQVDEEINKVGQRLGFKTALIIGGANMDRQMRMLKRRPHIIVATPGRLNDHIKRRTVRLDFVRMLVLDEADRMLDMGFAPQINEILRAVPKDHQTLLFSATMPDGVVKIAQGYMTDPVMVKVATTEIAARNIKQGIYYVRKSNKFDLLKDLLQKYKDGPVLVFCRTKHATQKMTRVLNSDGYHAEELHSNRSLGQRRRALENFKTGRSRVMIATDVAARGIDVKEIALVVNHDLPDKNEDYIHRIGRTGRAGHIGHAVSFAEPDQYRDVQIIERLIGVKIPILEARYSYPLHELENILQRYKRASNRRASAKSRNRSSSKRRYGRSRGTQGSGSSGQYSKHNKNRKRNKSRKSYGNK